ncbi:MAG: PilT/PilU family type 4a pilus ATPase [Patescibacteria group bacterium]|nr:PilT/PilU family type 4a pilus ATPase [Patescibacteria group bacterium]
MSIESSTYLTRALTLAVNSGASDVHFACGDKPIFRVRGMLQPSTIEEPVLKETLLEEIKQILLPEAYQILADHGDIDFSHDFDGIGRFRFAGYWKSGEPALAARIIPVNIPSLDDLEAPEAVLDFVDLQDGLVLVTGPTGAGKSTLLASMIDEINESRSKHIVTLEDPIEFIYTPKKCLISQRELGVDFVSFDQGLRHCFRQDPDVILIGEMRDVETISTALTLSETGHLVFATLHTGSAPQTIDRIVSSFPASQQQQIRLQLSLVLRGAISQILVPTVDARLVAVREVMVNNVAISNVIREGKTEQIPNIIYSSMSDKMVDLDRDLKQLIQEGRISPETAYTHARNKEFFNS